METFSLVHNFYFTYVELPMINIKNVKSSRSGGNYALKPDEARVEKAEHVTVKGGGKLVFGSLSARFKLWHHSWPLACLTRLPSIHV